MHLFSIRMKLFFLWVVFTFSLPSIEDPRNLSEAFLGSFREFSLLKKIICKWFLRTVLKARRCTSFLILQIILDRKGVKIDVFQRFWWVFVHFVKERKIIWNVLYWWLHISSQRWVQGFPKQNVHFITEDTICYPSGNYVIFINIETKTKTVLQCINGIVGVVATNIPYEVVAFSDRKLKPSIHIYNFPALTRRTKLKGILGDTSSIHN